MEKPGMVGLAASIDDNSGCTEQSLLAQRRTGPLVTWERPLVKTFGSKWMQLAITPVWQDSKSKFVDGAYAGLSTQTLEQRYSKSKTVESEPKASADCADAENLSQSYDSTLLAVPNAFAKKVRQVEWEPQDWTLDGHCCRLELCGDSNLIVHWINGLWPVKFLPYSRRLSGLQCQLHELVQCGIVRPRQDCADFCRHIFRELNGKADELANRHCNTWHLEAYSKPACCVRGFFDGSVRGDKAAFGWIVLASCVGDDDMSSWKPVACKSGCLPDGATITAAELEAALSLVSFLQSYYQCYEQASHNISAYAPMNYDIIRSLALAELL
jgi:hypothetical protein